MEVTISGKLINYDVIGAGAPILFVHGWGGDRNSLKQLAEYFESRNQCYLIDLPGFGKSDNPDGLWGIEEYADLVRKFVLELNISPIAYVGHSFGGALGIQIASQDEDLVDKLVLISPSYRRPVTRLLKNFDINTLKKLLFPIRKFLYRVLYPNSVALKFAHLETNFRRIINTDLTSKIGEIKCKTLILWPSDDIETPLNDAYVLKDGITASELKIFGQYGHELPVTDPQVLVDNIKKFIS